MLKFMETLFFKLLSRTPESRRENENSRRGRKGLRKQPGKSRKLMHFSVGPTRRLPKAGKVSGEVDQGAKSGWGVNQDLAAGGRIVSQGEQGKVRKALVEESLPQLD